MGRKPLSAQQILALQVSERSMSVLSVMGSLFIMVTFIRWHYFRKPINRLVFYASFGNVMANVATLISTSAVPASRNDHPSPLCRFQGVLIQWFMMADSLWVFCMALNVMLVFFHQYTSRKLRRLEKWYLLFSYGVPFIPAALYLIVERATNQRIIGGATIWCWVDARVEWMRIAFFYIPVWIVLICTILIYVFTGRTIFERRKGLRAFSRMNNPPPITNPFTAGAINGIERTTEISIRYTSEETRETTDSDSTVVSPACGNDSRSSFSSTRNLSTNNIPTHGQAPPIAIKPSGFNKVNWSARAPEQKDERPPNYKTAISADTKTEYIVKPRSSSISHPVAPVRRNVAMEGNTAAWSYFKVAFLMFAALFIVWVPSTINRMQQFINRDNPIYGLNLASALVLPLQGFWNSMVYISTTWPECKRAGREVLDAIAGVKTSRSQQGSQRKNSDQTFTSPEHQDLDAEIPLSEMLDNGPPRNGPPRRMSHHDLS